MRQISDPSEVLQQLADRFQEAGEEFDLDPLTQQHNDSFSRVARKIRRIKVWFDSRQAGEHGQEHVYVGNGEAMIATDDGMAGMQFDLLDDAFWKEIMNDWETFQ